LYDIENFILGDIMKRLLFLFVLVGTVLFAKMGMMKMYQSVPVEKATILQKGDAKMFCSKCGMTLPMFYKTNHVATDEKGVVKQYCSIHCLVEDALNHKLKDMKVVDNSTLKFIPVEQAYYVVGSKVKGTMTKVSKYAFGTKEGALEFQKKNGGKIMRFDEVYEMVEKNLKKESAMIAKKQHKMAKMGGMIYKKMCKDDGKRFKTPAQAKAHIKSSGICGDLKGRKLQAVGLYLSGK
jgi:hypothetical protein